MKRLKQILLVSVLSLCTIGANAQGWALDMLLSTDNCYNTVGVLNYTLNNGSVKNIFEYDYANGMLRFVIKETSALKSTGNTLTITSSISCNPSSPIPTYYTSTFTFNSVTTCAVNFFSNTTGNFRLEDYIFFPRLSISYFPGCSGAITLNTQCTSGNNNSYPEIFDGNALWQITTNPSGSWTTLTDKNSSNISLSASELTDLGYSAPYTTTFYARVSDANLSGRQSAPESFNLSAPAPTVSISGNTDALCEGEANGTITLAISNSLSAVNQFYINCFHADGSFKVEPSVGVGTYQIINLKAGNWQFQVVNNFDKDWYRTCSTSINHTVNEPTQVVITNSNFLVQDAKCREGNVNSGSITATATGGSGTGYSYYFNGSLLPSNVVSNLVKGTYTIKATDSKGCSSVDYSKTVGEPVSPISVTLSPLLYRGYEISCVGASDGAVTATPSNNAVASYNFVWYTQPGDVVINGQSGQTLSGRGPGQYSVKLTDGNGCTANSSNATLSEPLAVDFVINPSGSLVCAGDKIGLTAVPNSAYTSAVNGQRLPATYSWDVGGEITATVTNKIAGTYGVTVRDQQGCGVHKTYTIIDPPGRTVAISSTTNYNGKTISCKGSSDGSLSATASGAVDSYAWYKEGLDYSSGISLNSIGGLNEGNYKVIVTYNSICTAESNTVFLDDPDPVLPAIANGTPISCTSQHDGVITATASGGTSPYTFNWTGIGSGASIVVGAGNYTVTATDANSCTGTTNILLLDPTPVTVSLAVTSNYNGLHLSCRDASDGSVHAAASGGAGSYTYAWKQGTTDLTATGIDLFNIGAGSYTVIAKDAHGCPATSLPVSVANPAAVTGAVAILSDYHGQHVSCYNSTDGSLSASASGGTNSFTYSWNTGATSALLSGLGSGNYTVTIRDQNNCSTTAGTTLINPTQIVGAITSSSNYNGYGITCSGSNDGFIQTTPSGGTGVYSYSWSGLSETSNRASNLGTGFYSVTVTDNNGCQDTKGVTITSPPVLSLSRLTANDIACFDGSDGDITLKAVGGTGTYEFSKDNVSWQTPSQFIGLKALTYTMRVRDINNCITQSTETLNQPSKLDITFTNETPAFCLDPRGGATAVVTGGVGGYRYEWRDNLGVLFDTDDVIANVKAGSYTLTSFDGNNCSVLNTVAITSTDGAKLAVNNIQSAKCSYSSDGSATLDIIQGDLPLTFRWPDGQTSNSGINLPGGTYNVEVTDVNNCVVTVPVIIPAPVALAIASMEISQPSCFGSCDGSLQVTAQGGVGGYSYLWPQGSGQKITGLCVGGYIVTVTDANNCTYEELISLGQPAPLQVSLFDRLLPSCNGFCDGEIEVEASGGNSSYQFAWNTGKSGKRATAICAGDHSVTVSDAKGCTVDGTFSLGQPAPLQVRLISQQQPSCNAACDGQMEVAAFGGTSSYSYTWASSSGAIANNICGGNNTVAVVDSKGCKLSQAFLLAEPAPLMVSLLRKKLATCRDGCDGLMEVIASGGNSNYQYQWKNKSALAIADNLCAGSYSVSVSDGKLCTTSSIFMLENTPALPLDLGGGITVCVGQSYALDAGNNWSSIKWKSNTGFTSTQQKVVIKDPGSYWLEVLNDKGCVAQDTFLLETSTDLMKASFLIPEQAVVGDTIAIIDISWPLPESIEWNYPASMRKVKDLGDVVFGQFDVAGEYSIGLTAHLGECLGQISKTITIINDAGGSIGGRLGYEENVKKFTLYPNPNDGSFEVGVELMEEGAISLSVWDSAKGTLIGHISGKDNSSYKLLFDLRPLSSGTYTIRLDHSKGKMYLRFIVY